MEENQGRTSPPLPSRGGYNIDFDTLDDSFNPFQSKKAVCNSPPLAKKVVIKSNDTASESQTADQDGNSFLNEPSEAPKKKKSKSPSSKSKRASGGSDIDGIQNLDGVKPAGEGPEDVSVTPAAEKPVKTKKVKKPKSRPVSKNLEEQGPSENVQPLESQVANIPPPAEGDTPKLSQTDKTKTEVSQSTPVDNHPTKPQPDRSSERIPPQEETLPVQEKPQSLEKTHEEDASPEKSSGMTESTPPQTEATTQADKLPPQMEKTLDTIVSEEGTESHRKKERSAGKVKKSKSKVKKSSSSSPRRSTSEGAIDGSDTPSRHTRESTGTTDSDQREIKHSPRSSSQGQGDGGGVHDSSVDVDVVKTKHPAARVLEQQVRDESHSPALTRNNLPNDSEDDFYDAIDSSAHMTMDMMDPIQSYSDMNDSCTLFQSPDDLGGLTWSQEESTLLDEGAGEAAFAEDLTIGDSDMADGHSTESVVKLVQVLKYSQSDWNKLRQELELNFQAQLLNKEREWSAKLANRDARLAGLEDTNKKLQQTNEDMRTVMGEFEKTIGQLQSEKEKTSNASQQSLQDVVKERDQALEDLQSVETAFSDLHRRYEKTKGVVEGFKQNEEMLKKCVQDLQNKLKKAEQKVQTLKEQAEEKLERATEEIEKTQKSAASEIAKLEAALRKAEVQVQSMESSLEQKVKENKELAAICDELIAKVQ